MTDAIATSDRRLTRVETEIEALATNMDRLTNAVAAQSTQIGQLAVAVNAASGPRKTDWQLVLGGVGLILAIGAAAFSPLLLRINDTQLVNSKLEARIEAHQNLDMHPVGLSKVVSLEAMTATRWKENKDAITELDVRLQREFGLVVESIKEQNAGQKCQLEALDARTQHEFTAVQDIIKLNVTQLQEQLDRRLNRLEQFEDSDTERGLSELQQRRLRDDTKCPDSAPK